MCLIREPERGEGFPVMTDSVHAAHSQGVLRTRAYLTVIAASVVGLVACSSSGARSAASTSPAATSSIGSTAPTTSAQSTSEVTVPDSPLRGDSWTLATGHTASGASCLTLSVESVAAPQSCVEKALLESFVATVESRATGFDAVFVAGFLAGDTQISSFSVQGGADVPVVQGKGFYVASVPKGQVVTRLAITQSGSERTCQLSNDDPALLAFICGA